MFSEYASRYLSRSQRPMPLFNRTNSGDSDVDDYLAAMSASSEEGSESDSGSSSLHSEDEEDDAGSDTDSPPADLLVERPKKATKRAHKHRLGRSILWKSRRPPQDSAPLNPNAGDAQNWSDQQDIEASPRDTDVESDGEGPAVLGQARGKPLDNTVAAIYLLSMALSLSTALMVAFSAPPGRRSEVYPIFVYSFKPLLAYAALSAVISALWLACMRHFARAVVQVSVFAVPVVLVATAVVPLVFSIHPAVGWHGLAHAAMRVSTLAPLGGAVLWVAYLRRVRNAMGSAAELVVLAAAVFNESTPATTVLATVSGIGSLVVTGVWSFFFARAFLDGSLGVLLGLWLSFLYLWTWGLLCSLMRAVLTGITTEWYVTDPGERAVRDATRADGDDFMDDEPDSSRDVLGRSFYEAMTYHFSSACFSALVSLLVRFPMLLLPARLGAGVQRAVAFVLSTSTGRVLSPLALPTAVVNRSSLSSAAQALGSPEFGAVDRRSYRLAKLFLVSARVCCSLVVGFIAWVHADRVQDVSSAYGYLVAVIALFLGWTVMGASENMLSMILDALLVNFVINEESPRRKTVRALFLSEEANMAEAQADIRAQAGSNSEFRRNASHPLESEYSDSS